MPQIARTSLRLPFAAVLILLLGTACTERTTTTGAGPLPVRATAYPDPPGAAPPVAKDSPQDIQELRVEIVDGEFQHDVYDAQARATRLVVVTEGGPYTISIEQLLQPREVAANSTTEIGLTLPNPGEYRMELASGRDEATLNVRPPGGR